MKRRVCFYLAALNLYHKVASWFVAYEGSDFWLSNQWFYNPSCFSLKLCFTMRLQLLEWATELVQDTQKLKLCISNTINFEKKLFKTAICEAQRWADSWQTNLYISSQFRMHFRPKNMEVKENNLWFNPWFTILQDTKPHFVCQIISQMFLVLGLYNFDKSIVRTVALNIF